MGTDLPPTSMQRTLAFLALSPLLLSACARGPSVGEDLAQKLENPLYARQYYSERMDYMVSLVIRNDPQTLSGATAERIDRLRTESLDRAREASRRELEGPRGSFSGPLGEVEGDVVLLGDTLFLGPNFYTSPGADLRMLLTDADPRAAGFPAGTTVDLGPLKDAFGAQRYSVPPEARSLRTLVLWDRELGRAFGVVQLQE